MIGTSNFGSPSLSGACAPTRVAAFSLTIAVVTLTIAAPAPAASSLITEPAPAAASAPAPAPAAIQQSARDIVDQVDRLMRGESSHGVATMEIVTEHWSRSITMEVNRDIWNYLPKVDRTVKIPASMMSGSWMGSHFTNDDLIKDRRLIDDYDIETAFDGERDGETVWEFTLTPKPDAPVVWGHIEYVVRQHDLMPLSARFFDEDGGLSRTMEFTDFQDMGGRLVPALMTMHPADKPGETTSMRYSDLEFDVDIDENFFSLQTLRRRR